MEKTDCTDRADAAQLAGCLLTIVETRCTSHVESTVRVYVCVEELDVIPFRGAGLYQILALVGDVVWCCETKRSQRKGPEG